MWQKYNCFGGPKSLTGTVILFSAVVPSRSYKKKGAARLRNSVQLADLCKITL